MCGGLIQKTRREGVYLLAGEVRCQRPNGSREVPAANKFCHASWIVAVTADTKLRYNLSVAVLAPRWLTSCCWCASRHCADRIQKQRGHSADTTLADNARQHARISIRAQDWSRVKPSRAGGQSAHGRSWTVQLIDWLDWMSGLCPFHEHDRHGPGRPLQLGRWFKLQRSRDHRPSSRFPSRCALAPHVTKQLFRHGRSLVNQPVTTASD